MLTGEPVSTHGSGEGVFNVPGYDTLPLSAAAQKWGTPMLPMPERFVRPAYRLRHLALGSEFSYGINRNQLLLGLVLDGSRARNVLGYEPAHPVAWQTAGPLRTDV